MPRTVTTVLLALLIAACNSAPPRENAPSPLPSAEVEEFNRYQALNAADYQEFIQLRCIRLGQALADIASDKPDRNELGKLALADIRKIEKVKGRIVPREVDAELAKPEPDKLWLAARGALLIAAYEFESSSRQRWEVAAARMKSFGMDGEEFLIAQMVKRLASANSQTRDWAAYILADVADKPLAARALSDATFVELANQDGVFPQRTSAVLARLGSPAVTVILDHFHVNGVFEPAGSNWKSRRYLVRALGAIEDRRAADTLIKELEQLKLNSDDSEFVYRQVLIEALGRIGDERAIEPILKAWEKDESLTTVARQALFELTGNIADTPADFRKLNKR